MEETTKVRGGEQRWVKLWCTNDISQPGVDDPQDPQYWAGPAIHSVSD